MKKLFLISVLSVLAVACGNNAQQEAEEEKKRDSMANAQKSLDERLVEEMEAKDDSIRKAQEAHMHDSSNHDGHDHDHGDGHGHSH
jgi:hypothetical protein